MILPGLRRRVAASRVAPLAVMPSRVAVVGRHELQGIRASAGWLVRSREHTNFTYDLTRLNQEHLAWYIAAITGAAVTEVRGYFKECDDDHALRQHILAATAASSRRFLADEQVRFARRTGWYALVRALKPNHVVETGTDKGLGSVLLAAALLRNGAGRLTTFDVNVDSGYLIKGRYAGITDRVIADAGPALRRMDVAVDLFIHDSLHTYEHELAEYEAVTERLSDSALVLSDNAHATSALPTWAERSGRQFLFFAEKPSGHWYPGGGIGAAFRKER